MDCGGLEGVDVTLRRTSILAEQELHPDGTPFWTTFGICWMIWV